MSISKKDGSTEEVQLKGAPPAAAPVAPLVQAARTAEGKMKLGADPAALGKSLGSSLYQGNASQVITKELLQNAMDAVRGVSGDNNVTAELFSGTYPPQPEAEVVPYGKDNYGAIFAIQQPNGGYLTEIDPQSGRPKVRTWRYHWDAEQEQRKLFPKRDNGDRVIKITDTGKGMTKEELETVFSDLGASGKRNLEDASGGFGLAKAAPMMMSERLEVSTVTNENGKLMRHSFSATPADLLGEGVDINSEELPADSGVKTGTTITSHLPKNTELYGAQGFIQQTQRSLRPPGTLRAFLNSKDILKTNHQPLDKEPIASAEVPGAILDLYTSHAKSDSPLGKYSGISTEINNNGIYQFSKHANLPDSEGLRGLPTRIAVDVRATVPEGHPDYPFTANRESLRGEKINEAIDKMVKEKITNAIIEAHKKQIAEMYWNFPKIDGYIPLFDSGGRLKPEELEELMGNAAVNDIANAILDLSAEARNLLTKAAENNYALGNIGEKTKRIGIVLSSDVHGVHITNPEDKDHATVFINPFDKEENTPDDYASLMWHTIQHELVHDEVSGHNESFTTGFKNVSRALGSLNIKALTELRDKYADPNDSTRLRPDFDRAFQIYTQSRARNESTPDIFRGEESRTGLDRPGGKEDREGSVRDSGEGVVPAEQLTAAHAEIERIADEMGDHYPYEVSEGDNFLALYGA